VLWSVASGRRLEVPVPMSAEEFSEQPHFVDFVRNDALSLTHVEARLLFELRRARRQLPAAVRALGAPLLAAFAGDDPICDNARNRRLLQEAGGPTELREYPGARHVLEFSACRDAFFDDLTAWFERRKADA
jgi:alpha-beta hydrolase superfamily lysophospholipase